MTINAEVRRWGNSMGVILPMRRVRNLGIVEGDRVVIEIKKQGNVLKELFGTSKSLGNTKEIIKRAREELKSKWMK